jgi:hypothetical protein
MEVEIVHLRKELDTECIQTRYENSSKILDNIITTQRDLVNKNGIGYSKKKNLSQLKMLCRCSPQYIQEEK